MRPHLLAIIGPTATGKSNLAILLARRLHGEIVSADSRQVYRGLDIGSGKVSRREQRLVPHHLLDVATPRRVYTVAHFVRDGQHAIRGILRRGNLPIVVGGTGFWVDTLLRGQRIPNVPPNPALRRKLAKLSPAALFRRLQRQDPRRAATIDRHNPVRLVRALEILAATKRVIPPTKQTAPYDVLWLGVNFSDRVLRQRIHQRLHQRLRQGMVAEVRRLLAAGVPARRLLDLGLEYRYVTRLLQGELTNVQCETQLETAIWHYAKRQRTWFKRHTDIHWVRTSKAALALARRYVSATA